MNSLNNKTNRIAGLVAILATAVTCGGTLTLADHYARSGSGGQQYLAAAHHATSVAPKRAS